MLQRILYKYIITACLIILTATTYGQRFLSDYDTSFFFRDSVRTYLRRMENLHFSGYIQPQFQVAQQKGAASFNGGAFSEFSSNRFILRRARVKIDYILPAKDEDFPKALFTFQIDATERGVAVRDMFLHFYEPRRKSFSLATGLFARPFGFEVNLSSAYRETPERGRMSQILMPSERDLGAMVSYERRNKKRKAPFFKFDIGAFNGQGLSGNTDFDSYKDIISRFTVKPFSFSKVVSASAGLSLLQGGWRQATRYVYRVGRQSGTAFFMVDSSFGNIGAKAPRRYYGGDMQVVYKHAWGKTEFRGEYWEGTQSGTAATTANPGNLPAEPTYIRNFEGAFFYFLQNIVNTKWELMAKYDWYDPNRKVSSTEIGKTGTNLTAADIKFSTLGIGFTRYFTGNYKVLVYYDIVRNEKTDLTAFIEDIDDNIFTLRFQLRF